MATLRSRLHVRGFIPGNMQIRTGRGDPSWTNDPAASPPRPRGKSHSIFAATPPPSSRRNNSFLISPILEAFRVSHLNIFRLWFGFKIRRTITGGSLLNRSRSSLRSRGRIGAGISQIEHLPQAQPNYSAPPPIASICYLFPCFHILLNVHLLRFQLLNHPHRFKREVEPSGK